MTLSALSFAESPEEPNPQELPMSELKKQKKDKVHYISLKPFSKKERKRQKEAAAAAAAEAAAAEEAAEAAEEEEFRPRSPVPLPDASTCKSILVDLGFALGRAGADGKRNSSEEDPEKAKRGALLLFFSKAMKKQPNHCSAEVFGWRPPGPGFSGPDRQGGGGGRRGRI